MGFSRMKTGHLLEQGQNFAELRLDHVLLEEVADRLIVGLFVLGRTLLDGTATVHYKRIVRREFASVLREAN